MQACELSGFEKNNTFVDKIVNCYYVKKQALFFCDFHQLSLWIVVAEDCSVIKTLPGHSIGSPLAQAHAMTPSFA